MALHKYLQQYAEVESRQLDDALKQKQLQFHHGLVIPAYQESNALINRCNDFASENQRSLIIIVLNRPESDHQLNWAKQFLCHPVFHSTNIHWQSANNLLTLYTLPNNGGLLLVDRCLDGAPIPSDQGVGLARKIGADILCQLIEQGMVQSPWIANTDADATLPAEYFSTLDSDSSGAAAIIFPFEHVFGDNDPYQLATLLYEFSLHYYVAGLHWAGSPYAFHTVGSTLALHYQHYAMVRGFPKRSAAEDFYLLNKIAKTGPVASLLQPRIQLQARASARVPFGTGPAVSKLAAQNDPLAMPLYHPDCFLYLKVFLQLIDDLARHRTGIDTAIESLHPFGSEAIDAELLLQLASSLKLEAAVNHAHRQGREKTTRLQHLQQWFDGFKTLKFIHQLRDQRLHSISFRHWLQTAEHYSFQIDFASNTRPQGQHMKLLIQRIEAAT